MKMLIVEDDFTSRALLQRMLSGYGTCDVAVNGNEAVEAFTAAHEAGEPYALICLDIMMPGLDGQQVLKTIRGWEEKNGVKPQDEVKIIMTSALGSPRDVFEAFSRGGCTSYLVKPIEKRKLLRELEDLRLIG